MHLNKRARLWSSAELLVLLLVLSEAVLAIEKDGKGRVNCSSTSTVASD